MEKEPEVIATEQIEWPEPPPFEPDPDLITHLERGDKPTRDEVRKVTQRSPRPVR